MNDPIDIIRDIIDEGAPDALSRIADVLGFDDDVMKNAARYRWLRERTVRWNALAPTEWKAGASLDAAIDAARALAAQQAVSDVLADGYQYSSAMNGNGNKVTIYYDTLEQAIAAHDWICDKVETVRRITAQQAGEVKP
jgi:hypothetical protein